MAEVTEENQAQAKQIIAGERQFTAQSHFVKIMKAQKTYHLQNLVSDVIRNITCRLDQNMVKKE